MRKDWLLTCAIAAFVVQAPVFGQTIVEIRAVKVNDVNIPPTTTPNVNPGDKVQAELILLPGYGVDLPTGVRGAQIVIGGRAGVTSGGNDRAVPLGWDAPLDLIQCTVQQDCPLGLLCSAGQCRGDSHFPDLGGFVTTSRPDFLHFGEDALVFVGTTTLNYTFVSADRTIQGQVDDGNSEHYLGTYIVELGDFACGTFTFTGVTTGFQGISELIAPDNLTTVTPTFVPLEINTGACGPVPSDSLNCSLDARYPHAPTRTSPRFAGKSFVIDFTLPPTGLTAGDFLVSQTPPSFPSPTIASISVQGTVATVTMSAQFADDRWTCIRHIDTDRAFCRANLPGDSDQSQLVEIADIDALIVDLRSPVLGEDGEPYVPLGMHACDIDRSGICSPLDLLGSVNLLGGAEMFAPPWLGADLGFVCPGAEKP